MLEASGRPIVVAQVDVMLLEFHLKLYGDFEYDDLLKALRLIAGAKLECWHASVGGHSGSSRRRHLAMVLSVVPARLSADRVNAWAPLLRF